MSVFAWILSRFSSRSKALYLYRRGMVKARHHDHQGAIEDYSATIQMQKTPDDVTAMVLYNRALAYIAAGEHPQGIQDLGAVLSMSELFINVRTLARQKLAREEARVKSPPRPASSPARVDSKKGKSLVP